MNIWKHSQLSQKKFGGKPEDYIQIHKFLDSSKLFYYHVKHRLLLHNLYGIELCCELLGDVLLNSDGKNVVVRDIAAEHCKEDLSGVVPSLNDWLKDFKSSVPVVPEIEDEELKAFVLKPYLRSGIEASMFITCSNFGVSLVEKFLGNEKALMLAKQLPQEQTIQSFLKSFKFSEHWQYTPDISQLKMIEE